MAKVTLGIANHQGRDEGAYRRPSMNMSHRHVMPAHLGDANARAERTHQ